MTDSGTEDLRRAFTAPGGRAPRPEECPEPETIWAAVHGELPPAELRDVVDHTATCGACAEDWRLAVEADREDVPAALTNRSADPISAARPLLYPRRWARFVPMAAAAAAIVLLVVGLPRLRQEGPSHLRGVGQVVSLVKGPTLPRSDCRLHWEEVPGATYEVEVKNTFTGDLLDAASGLTAPQHLVPAAKLAGTPAGTRLEWRVTAHLPGEAPLRSKTFRFSLR